MPTIALLKIDHEHVAECLQDARTKLESADGELVLDFSTVARIDAPAVTALEGLAASAKERSTKITLRAVNVDVYKVLKLARLTSRFSFLV